MGTAFRIVAYAPDREQGARAIEAAFARVDELNALLSDYDEESELSRLSARSAHTAPTGPIPVSDELWSVLVAAQAWSRETGGAFDVTVGPFTRLWRRSVRQAELPSQQRLDAAAGAVGFDKLRLIEATRAVELLARDMRLDLGGIAKGYALDECLRVLRAHGIEAALVDGGGDVAVGAPPPGRAGWRIELAPLAEEEHGARPVILLARAAAATSGASSRQVEIDGRRYAHIVDPRTGLGLTRRIGATVIAADAMTADAVASALCVLGPEAGLELLERHAEIEGRIVFDEQAASLVSAGFGRLLAPRE